MSIGDMNDALIANWNKVVQKEDIVYHLGDFAMKGDCSQVKSIIDRLNGTIYLVPGSHDKLSFMKRVASDRFVILNNIHIFTNPVEIVLCHYSMRVWWKSHYNVGHLFGHSHGGLNNKNTGKSFDVGVDCHNYTPVSLDTVMSILKDKPDNFNLVKSRL